MRVAVAGHNSVAHFSNILVCASPLNASRVEDAHMVTYHYLTSRASFYLAQKLSVLLINIDRSIRRTNLELVSIDRCFADVRGSRMLARLRQCSGWMSSSR
jgi:hypothetical protein